MNQRRISCEPWLRLQRAHLGKPFRNFNEHVQGLHQRRAVEVPNLRFLHVVFGDCQVSGVARLAINLVILVLTLLIFVWTSSSSVGGYLPRKLSNKIFSSSSLGSVFSASEGSTLTFATAAAGFLRTGDAMAIEAGRYRTNVVPLSWSVSSMTAAVSFGPADEPLKMPWQDIPDKPTISKTALHRRGLPWHQPPR